MKRKKLIITSSEGLSLSMKAVWTMSLALKKIEEQHCIPTNMSKAACMERLKGLGLRELVLNQTRHLNYDKLSGLGVAAMVHIHILPIYHAHSPNSLSLIVITHRMALH